MKSWFPESEVSVKHLEIHAWGQVSQEEMIKNHQHRGKDLSSIDRIFEGVSTIGKRRKSRTDPGMGRGGTIMGKDNE